MRILITMMVVAAFGFSAPRAGAMERLTAQERSAAVGRACVFMPIPLEPGKTCPDGPSCWTLAGECPGVTYAEWHDDEGGEPIPPAVWMGVPCQLPLGNCTYVAYSLRAKQLTDRRHGSACVDGGDLDYCAPGNVVCATCELHDEHCGDVVLATGLPVMTCGCTGGGPGGPGGLRALFGSN